MKYEVELCLLWDLARSLRRLKSERSQLGEEEGETGIVVVRFSNDGYWEVDAGLKILEGSLERSKEAKVSVGEQEEGKRRDATYDENSNGQIPPPQHPERPSSQPPMASTERQRNERVLKDPSKDRSVVSFNDSSDGDGELPIVQLTKADVDGVLDASSE